MFDQYDATQEVAESRAGRQVTFTGNETAYQAARKILKAVVSYYMLDPEYGLAIGDRAGGNLTGTKIGRSLTAGYGYYPPAAGSGGAQVIAEDADYEWAYSWCDGIQSAIDAAGLELFAEPACGFAINIYKDTAN